MKRATNSSSPSFSGSMLASSAEASMMRTSEDSSSISISICSKTDSVMGWGSWTGSWAMALTALGLRTAGLRTTGLRVSSLNSLRSALLDCLHAWMRSFFSCLLMARNSLRMALLLSLHAFAASFFSSRSIARSRAFFCFSDRAGATQGLHGSGSRTGAGTSRSCSSNASSNWASSSNCPWYWARIAYSIASKSYV